MISVSVIFALVALVVGGLLLSNKIPPWLRNLAYPVLLLSVVVMWAMALGHAKPYWAAVDINRETLIVEAVYPDEPNQAIYLVVHSRGSATPQFIRLPWSESTAAKVSDMLTISKASGAELSVTADGMPEGGEPPTFKIIQPVPPPPKEP